MIPSETEVLYALGAGDRIAAVTTADDYPPEVKQKPTIGNVLNSDVEQILAQKPDLVVAIGSLNQKPIAALEALHVPVLVVDPKNLADTYASIRLLGQAVGAESAGRADRRRRCRHVWRRCRRRSRRPSHRPRVLMLYGTDPIYTTGPDSFINDLITQAGGQNIVDRPIATNIISPEEVALRQPEVILCSKRLTEQGAEYAGLGAAACRPSETTASTPMSRKTAHWCAPRRDWRGAWRRWPGICIRN